MSRVDLQVALSFQRLKTPELRGVVAHLQQVYLESLEKMADVGDESQWRKLQGRAQLARELLDLAESSSELVAKLSRPQQ